MESMYTLTEGQVGQSLAKQVSASTLQAVKVSLAGFGNAPVNVQVETDSSTVSVGPPPALVVIKSPANAPQLDALSATDLLKAPAGDAVTISNTSGTPGTIVAETSTFLELMSGGETVIGGDAPSFVADAEHDSAAVLMLAGSGRSFLIGGPGDDTLVGSSSPTGSATLVAGTGSSTLLGGAGHDELFGSTSANGSAILAAGPGPNTLVGGLGSDVLFASAGGGDVLIGGAGSTTMVTAGGSNTLYGGAHTLAFLGAGSTLFVSSTAPDASDTIVGSQGGQETVFGGASDEVFALGSTLTYTAALNGSASIVGGSGQETMFGQSGSQINFFGSGHGAVLVAGGGAETLSGAFADGGNAFYAGSGSDVIYAGSGNDSLIAGTGTASLLAGSGSDVFGFVNGSAGGSDTIYNFGAKDTLALVGYGTAADAAALANQKQVTGGVSLTLSDKTTIVIAGVSHLNSSQVFSS